MLLVLHALEQDKLDGEERNQEAVEDNFAAGFPLSAFFNGFCESGVYRG
jgi:hypothetical protein